MTAEPRATARWAIAVAVPVLLALWCVALVGRLFVFTEAQYLLDGDRSIDLVRYALLPHLQWGDARLTGLALFTATGAACGLSPECANTVTALITLVAALLLLAHAWQLTRSAILAAVAVVLWGFSPSVLSGWIWQATWYDQVAALMSLATVTFWWWALGRATLSRLAMILVSLASVLLLMVAFNAKETNYHLAGVLVLLAAIRGATVEGGLRRNALIALVPLGYAAWFIGVALLTIDPGYAGFAGARPIIDGLAGLIGQALGTSRHFSFLDQQDPLGDAVRKGTAGLFLLFGLAFAAAAVVAAWRSRPIRRPASLRALIADWGPEVYLLAVVVTTLVAGSRSSGASAYYTLIPRWAAGLLALLLIRRVARALPHPSAVTAGLVGLLGVAALTGYAGDLVPASTAPRVIADSARWRETLGTIRALLDGRRVEHVRWRVDGSVYAAFYLLRTPGNDVGGPDPWRIGDDIWPWIVGERNEVAVEPLEEGTAADWAARAGEVTGPGEVLIVTSADSRLALLVHEGQVLAAGPTVAPTPAPADPSPAP